MNTSTITMNLLSVLLLCAGAVQAAEPQATATERPLDLSVPHDATALQAWRKKHALERQNRKPYGSGYEARGLGEPRNSAAGNGNSGSGRSGGGSSSAGSGGGSGGSGH